jgi:hypothetical protein
MKNVIRQTMSATAKIDGHTLRTILFIGSLIVFSLIAGAPNAGSGG